MTELVANHDHDWDNWQWVDDETARAQRCAKCDAPMIPEGFEGVIYDTIHIHRSRRDCPFPMSRRQAIEHIWGLESSVAHEFYVGAEDHVAGRREIEECLSALGVTPEEMSR